MTNPTQLSLPQLYNKLNRTVHPANRMEIVRLIVAKKAYLAAKTAAKRA